MSLMEAETKYSGKVIDFGHCMTFDVDNERIRKSFDVLRCIRFAHRCVRNRLLNIGDGEQREFLDSLKHTVMIVDWKDESPSLLYKLLNIVLKGKQIKNFLLKSN